MCNALCNCGFDSVNLVFEIHTCIYTDRKFRPGCLSVCDAVIVVIGWTLSLMIQGWNIYNYITIVAFPVGNIDMC